MIFDNDDENKFAYSDLHQEFKDLIENMISNKLAEVGIAAEDFAEACQSDRFGREVNKSVYEQVRNGRGANLGVVCLFFSPRVCPHPPLVFFPPR